MRARIIRIGNSRGIRLPKTVLEECSLDGEVELQVRNDSVIIRPVRSSREGWEEAYAAMAARRDDALLDEEAAPSGWDQTEWRW